MDNVKRNWKIVTSPSRLPTDSQQTKWTYQQHTPPAGSIKHYFKYIYIYIYIYTHTHTHTHIHTYFTAPNFPSIILSSPHALQIFISLSELGLSLSLRYGTFFPVNPLMLINGGLLCTWHSVDEASTWNATISEIPPTPLYNRVVRIFLFHLIGVSFQYKNDGNFLLYENIHIQVMNVISHLKASYSFSRTYPWFPVCSLKQNLSFIFSIRKYNFVCCFVWVWNSVADIEGGKEGEGVWEYGVEKNIWT